MLIASSAPPGQVHLEWWDPDTGTLMNQQDFAYTGDELSVTTPPFRRHLAFKLWRLSTTSAPATSVK